MKAGSVFTCYCHGGMIHEPFMISILRLLPYDAAHRHVVADFCGQRGLYIADNRNALCRQFLKSNSEWMWMLDTDITFEPQVLYQLLDSADPMKRPIVSAVYFSYVNSNEVLSPVWLERTANHDFRTIKDFDGGMQKLDAIGMGCVVIHRSVIEKFKAQYSEPFIWFGHDVLEHADGCTHGGWRGCDLLRESTNAGHPNLGQWRRDSRPHQGA